VESSGRYYYGSPTGEYYYGGFRVASVPTGWVHPDPGDANGDGKVDINDLTIVLSNFGMTYNAGAFGAVPEPASVLLLAGSLAGLGAYACRRRR